LVDVGPRDGLQNEKQPVSAAQKVELVHRLQLAGLREIEVTSFVSPKWVPQMADNAEVMAGIERRPGVRYSVLTPNLKGFEAALASRPDEVVIFAAATEAFSQRNINCSIAESIERFAPVVAAAHAGGIKVRAAVSCAVGCPYQGEVSADEVERVVVLLKAIGTDHVGIADTIGVGTPRAGPGGDRARLRHFPAGESERPFPRHLRPGAGEHLRLPRARRPHLRRQHRRPRRLPLRQGATGNVGTEDVLFMLRGLDIETGIDLDRLVDAAAYIAGVLGTKPVSRTGSALLAKRAALRAEG
jgi:hydroxymethylglutaryl-CoA lyase